VIGAPHPFPLPRLIAGFYLWNLTERQFLDQWNALRPADSWYLYYFAKRAMFEGESVVARLYLQKLKDMTAPASWEYIRLYQMLIGLGQH